MLLKYHFGYLMSLTIVRQDPRHQNWILNHRLYQPSPKKQKVKLNELMLGLSHFLCSNWVNCMIYQPYLIILESMKHPDSQNVIFKIVKVAAYDL